MGVASVVANVYHHIILQFTIVLLAINSALITSLSSLQDWAAPLLLFYHVLPIHPFGAARPWAQFGAISSSRRGPKARQISKSSMSTASSEVEQMDDHEDSALGRWEWIGSRD